MFQLFYCVVWSRVLKLLTCGIEESQQVTTGTPDWVLHDSTLPVIGNMNPILKLGFWATFPL